MSNHAWAILLEVLFGVTAMLLFIWAMGANAYVLSEGHGRYGNVIRTQSRNLLWWIRQRKAAVQRLSIGERIVLTAISPLWLLVFTVCVAGWALTIFFMAVGWVPATAIYVIGRVTAGTPERPREAARLLNQDQFGKLWELRLPAYRDMRLLEVKDAQPDKNTGRANHYLLGVPSHCSTPRQAAAWTFGLAEQQYAPVVET